jgi:hypothetical protein
MKTLDKNRRSVMLCQMWINNDGIEMPRLTKNGYSLVDSSVDIRESYLGELQMW